MAADPVARQAGARLYAHLCGGCHGDNRQGIGLAPALANARIYDAPAGELFWALRSGSLFTGMPGFAEMPDPQRWQIVTFLKEDRTGTASRSKP
jgi:mono/diheme cytochrome c family protein